MGAYSRNGKGTSRNYLGYGEYREVEKVLKKRWGPGYDPQVEDAEVARESTKILGRQVVAKNVKHVRMELGMTNRRTSSSRTGFLSPEEIYSIEQACIKHGRVVIVKRWADKRAHVTSVDTFLKMRRIMQERKPWKKAPNYKKGRANRDHKAAGVTDKG